MHLARRSFDLHAEFAEKHEGDWDYRRLTTYAGVVGRPTTRAPRGPSRQWISSDLEIGGLIGSVSATAQAYPATFTIGMMRAARARGADLKLGTVTGLPRRWGNVVGVDLGGEPVEADAIVIAMGPWSVLVARWLSFQAMWSLKGHGIVFETGALIPPEALFPEFEETDGSTL